MSVPHFGCDEGKNFSIVASLPNLKFKLSMRNFHFLSRKGGWDELSKLESMSDPVQYDRHFVKQDTNKYKPDSSICTI